MIDTSSWKEFRVTDFFTVLSGRNKLSNVDIDDGDTPVYSSNSYNGGIFGYTTKEPDYEISEDIPFYITFGDHTKAVNIVDKSFCVMDNVKVLITKIRNYNVLYFIITSWLKNVPNLGYARHWGIAEKTKIHLPATSEGQPDWDYMESYMKAVMEESEKSLENLKRADDTKHLIDVSEWGEFRVGDLFTKRTMKGYPKKAEVYDENENGYHIYGQNIGWQYPYKVLMDEQYLHKVEPDKPILAYASSVGEIGLINESFYRSGDNGAFQGLFPIGYHPNLLQMQFVLSILKKEFEKFRYDTSMQNTMDITFKLPIDANGEPNWQYMEDYMRNIMDKSEKAVEDLRKAV